MSAVEWTAVGIIVSTNLTVSLAGIGYLVRRIDRVEQRLDATIDRLDAHLSARLDRLEERYVQHLEHHARFA